MYKTKRAWFRLISYILGLRGNVYLTPINEQETADQVNNKSMNTFIGGQPIV